MRTSYALSSLFALLAIGAVASPLIAQDRWTAQGDKPRASTLVADIASHRAVAEIVAQPAFAVAVQGLVTNRKNLGNCKQADGCYAYLAENGVKGLSKSIRFVAEETTQQPAFRQMNIKRYVIVSWATFDSKGRLMFTGTFIRNVDPNI